MEREESYRALIQGIDFYVYVIEDKILQSKERHSFIQQIFIESLAVHLYRF